VRTTDEKTSRANFLLDEIGNVSDIIVNETIVTASQSAGRRKTKLVTAAISAAAAVMIIFTAVVVLMFFPRGADTSLSLGDYLLNKSTDIVCCTKEEIELFDTAPKLIWTTQESDGYYVIELSASQFADILNANVNAQKTDDTSDYQLWIADGKGNTYSPLLIKQYGNIGCGTIENYSPELVASDKLVECVMGILEDL